MLITFSYSAISMAIERSQNFKKETTYRKLDETVSYHLKQVLATPVPNSDHPVTMFHHLKQTAIITTNNHLTSHYFFSMLFAQ